ncbi:uncharacterized protein FOMMEDRAFT_167951 [Fomitiporia mediterranea MF3/22]|uniref:uncharacterized protein n=1 Tax=Fomitiporia mediterranea (strain MF3/22) TaxID=694068 RepID=UPI0004407444|nr:uncharacterized protein FOMMEDRAFT_167951 [Fomitiporia mediterranea MF3/22]EJD02802.1 hypothetical protein FOMMEDRAFT_167951 [Fomitiporia mediterranea MF3/22]
MFQIHIGLEKHCSQSEKLKDRHNTLHCPLTSTVSLPHLIIYLIAMLTSPPSKKETWWYYAGLPSNPRLVARTGIQWKAPTGPEAYRVIRELRTVGNHALLDVWEDNLALKIHDLLDTMKVKWTSTDVVRIGNAEESSSTVVLWIGIKPATLSGYDGLDVASKCRNLLKEYNITDVEVEIRECPRSTYHHSRSPHLVPFTPWAEGTGGFFIAEGDNKRLLLVTARHVVFPPDKSKNRLFEHKDDSQPRHNVTLFGDAAFERYLKSIQAEIEGKEFYVEYYGRCISEDSDEGEEGEDSPAVKEKHAKYQDEIDKMKKAKEALNAFYQDVSTQWNTPESRILGHVILSPPIDVGVSSECYTEDWAVIEIDPSKIDKSNFNGNAIYLGSFEKFIRMIIPDFGLQRTRSFDYPVDSLLKLHGTIPDEGMRYRTALDHDDLPCPMAIKRGISTGLTVGRANNIFSYVRNYSDDDNPKTSKEWAILPRNSESGAFSEKGDSGSVVVDRHGRIGGLLTGGTGDMGSDLDSFDISYATPITFLLKRMTEQGLQDLNIDPVLTA